MTTTPAYWLNSYLVNAGAISGAQGGTRTIGLANGNILTLWNDDTTGPSSGIDVIGTTIRPDGTPTTQINVQLNTAHTDGDQI